MIAGNSPADVYTDPKGLDDLKTRAVKTGGDLQTLRAVAGQFEALFIQMMLKSMRDASLGEGIFDSDQTETYQTLFDQQISVELAWQQDLGLADMLVQQLGPQITARSSHSGSPANPAALDGVSQVNDIAPVIDTGKTLPVREPTDWAPESREDFIDQLRPHAEQAAAELGVSPDVLLAQAALETGWGRAMIRDGEGRNSFNFFGIKADPSWDGASVGTGTLEFRDGVVRKERALFRAYADPAASFRDYAAFLKENPRYGQALSVASDGARYVKELQKAGYATDPEYANKIMRIVEAGGLRQNVTNFKNGEVAPLS